MARVGVISLGCYKNLVDSEKIMAALAGRGFEVQEGAEGARALIINTCGFIDPAKQESIDTIISTVRLKQSGQVEFIAAVGCMVELYREELQKEIPEVDLWLGLKDIDRLADSIAAHIRPEKTAAAQALRIITTPRHFSYLKIAEGCSHGCLFCTIPLIRGPYRSRTEKDIVDEARFLEEQGVIELNLIAQDTTAYGHDLRPRANLASLIEKIIGATKIPWIRILYAHPEHLDDALISLMAKEERLLSYIDIPLQHISDKILKAMGRRMSGRQTRELIERLRREIPGVTLRTTFLVGYPGETEIELEELLEFVEQVRFERMGTFAFSRQERSAAARLPEQVPEEEAEERLDLLLDTQQEISWEINQAMTGRRETILVDEQAEETEFDYLGRLKSQAYEIDGAVMLQGDFQPGEFAEVEIIEGYEYDLLARKAGEK